MGWGWSRAPERMPHMWKSQPCRARFARIVFPPQTRDRHETVVPPQEQETQQSARISGADEDALGPGCALAPAQEGAQATRGTHPLQARNALTSEALPRSWRLSQGSALAAVLRLGRRHRTHRLDIAWYPNDTSHPRLGVVVPRHGENAVARNRLRRRVREIARRQVLPQVGAIDLVLRARAGAYRASRDTLASDLGQWLASL